MGEQEKGARERIEDLLLARGAKAIGAAAEQAQAFAQALACFDDYDVPFEYPWDQVQWFVRTIEARRAKSNGAPVRRTIEPEGSDIRAANARRWSELQPFGVEEPWTGSDAQAAKLFDTIDTLSRVIAGHVSQMRKR